MHYETAHVNGPTGAVHRHTDDLLRALARHERRLICRQLPADTDTLAEAIAAETGTSVRGERVQLRHAHLPQLEDAEIVRVDGDRVDAGPRLSTALAVLDVVDG